MSLSPAVDPIIPSLVHQSMVLGKNPFQLTHPLTQQVLGIPDVMGIMKQFLNKYDKKTTYNYQQIQPVLASAPRYKRDIQPTQFQLDVQRYVRNLPFEYQLEQLNKIQEDCPFLIVDPMRRQLSTLDSAGSNIKYGFADLYRFLGLSYVPAKVGKVKLSQPKKLPSVPASQNPFYQPVNYNFSIPDTRGNMMLSKLYQFSPHSYYTKIKTIYDKLGSFYGMRGGAKDGIDKKSSDLYIETNMQDMMKLFQHWIERETSPDYLREKYLTMGRSDRPMQNYFNSNFNALLDQMRASHLIYKFDYKPPKDVEYSSKQLDSLKNAMKYYQSHPEAVEVQSRPVRGYDKKRTTRKHRSAGRPRSVGRPRSSGKHRSSKHRSSHRD